MTKWLVEYNPYLIADPHRKGVEREIPCFRIFPADHPERWIAQTNEDLPSEVQEEAAMIMADGLTRALG
jgi:hypothetical protein